MPGAQCTRSLVCDKSKHTSIVTTVTPESSRHSPRNGFTTYFALSPVTTLFDTVACASYRRLDANDWGVRTTRLGRTQADRVRLARCRVHRIPPHVDDVRNAPLSERDGADQ